MRNVQYGSSNSKLLACYLLGLWDESGKSELFVVEKDKEQNVSIIKAFISAIYTIYWRIQAQHLVGIFLVYTSHTFTLPAIAEYIIW